MGTPQSKPYVHKQERESRLLLRLKPMIPLRFRGQAMLFLFPMIIIISAVYTLDSISTERSILRNEILKRGETIAAIAAKGAELPLLSENMEQLKHSALAAMEIKDIAFVSFFNREFMLLLHEGKRHPVHMPPMKGQADSGISMKEHDEIFEFIVPVVTVKAAEGLFLLEESGSAPPVKEQVGWVRLGLSKEVMINSEHQIIFRSALFAVIFSIGGTLLLYLVIALATRPLYTLINAVKEVREGEHPEVPVEVPDSEIGMLSTEFNRMSMAIKEREDELRKHRDHLEELVEERTAELTVAKEQAESANRAKSDFLSSMSHELRTPLNAILGYAQILRLQSNITPNQRQQLDIMRTSGEHLLMLINDILDVGEIEANKVEVNELPFDLPGLLLQVVNITRLQSEEKDLRLSYEAETPLPSFVRGDERKLRQILLNLLSNAVKYTIRGGITIRVSYDRSGSEMFRCSITDTGIGIPADKLEEIFEPFTQVSRARHQLEGTGLGLNITRRLLTLLEGTISVDSVVGSGTTFTIELRLASLSTAEVPEDQPAQRVIGYSGERKRVLVVDDNITNSSMVVSLLGPLGFDLDAVQNGEEAIARAKENHPDLILLDLLIPEMDRMAIVDCLRRTEELPTATIIGVSDTVADHKEQEALQAACDDLIEKPVNMDILLEKIAKHLRLDWKRETAPRGAGTEPSPKSGSALKMPAPEKTDELYRYAMLGDMQKIEEWAAAMKAWDPELQEFAEKLLLLTAKFKTKEIVALVSQCRGDGNG